jgi:hypothetical protein
MLSRPKDQHVRLISVRRTLFTLVAVTSVMAGAFTGLMHLPPARAATTTPVVGNDISWPECPKGLGIPSRRSEGKPLPPRTAKFAVIGLTNGPGYYPNPCLALQVAWAKRNHAYTAAYAMTTYPTSAQLRTYGRKGPWRGTDLASRLRNAGYAEARYNVASMRKTGLQSPIVWIDVEPYRWAPWTRSTAGNRAVVVGAMRGYTSAGIRVGFYSTSSMWRDIVGSVRFGLPEWHTSGQSSLAAAQRACSAPSFQGGRVVLGQWWSTVRDYDVVCPRFQTPTAMKSWFHKY